MPRRVAFVVLASLAAACGPRIDHLRMIEAFTYPALQEERVAFTPAGCMVSPKKVSTEDLSALREAAVRLLAEARPRLPVVGAQDADLALGEEVWNPLMTHTRTGKMPVAEVKHLAALAQVRFLAVLRVEFWTLRHDTEEIVVPREGGGREGIAFRKRTRATLQLRLTVYDAQDGAVAWLGIHEASGVRDAVGPVTDPSDAGAVAAAKAAAAAAAWPEPPLPAEVAADILTRFFAHWPKPLE